MSLRRYPSNALRSSCFDPDDSPFSMFTSYSSLPSSSYSTKKATTSFLISSTSPFSLPTPIFIIHGSVFSKICFTIVRASSSPPYCSLCSKLLIRNLLNSLHIFQWGHSPMARRNNCYTLLYCSSSSTRYL